MPHQTRIVLRGKSPRTVRTDNGEVLKIPSDWELLPPGDAGMTRRVKSAGPTWTVHERRGRRKISLGVWTKSSTIVKIRADLEAERQTPAYAKRRASATKRRDKKQTDYIKSFYHAVLKFLDFGKRHQLIAEKMAKAITEHATPIGSGTVARTERIPIERRAESAVIAWMRHQTNGL